ncbi:phage tail tube protein, partial [uncultured Oscillibacter sp.]
MRHTIISNLDDPDNPRNQRIAVKGVIFDDLTLADWEA